MINIDLGCWKDDVLIRAIPSLEGKDGVLSDNYKTRDDAIKKCAEVARQRGYTVFALQDGGWCASSLRAKFTYSKYGQSQNCEGDGKGGPAANRVYEILSTGKR